jgi:hypothetical protein
MKNLKHIKGHVKNQLYISTYKIEWLNPDDLPCFSIEPDAIARRNDQC